MREIKFRAWDKKDKIMHTPSGYSFIKEMHYGPEFHKIIIAEYYPDETWGFNEIKDFEIMQYTRLKDKNGVEIYEGDVLKHEGGCTSVVTPVEGGWVVKYICEDDYGNLYSFSSIKNNKEIKIIGNIHENPELLNNK